MVDVIERWTVAAAPLTAVSSGKDFARTFISGSENQLAHFWGSRLVSPDYPLEAWPFKQRQVLLVGPPGCGKSLWLEMVAAGLRRKVHAQRVRHLSAEEWSQLYSGRLVPGGVKTWLKDWHDTKVLSLDDIHRLLDRAQSQSELCRVLDHAPQTDLIVLMTSRTHPLQDRLQAHLTSRLLGGLIIPMALPQLETRVALLMQFAKEREWLTSPAEVREFARQHAVSPAELQRAFMDACSSVPRGNRIPLQLLQPRRGKNRDAGAVGADMKLILELVSRHFSVSPRDVIGSSRRRTLATVRGVVIYLARTITSMSLQDLGRSLGNRDHSTVINSLRRIENLMISDLALRDTVQILAQKLRGHARTTKTSRMPCPQRACSD